MDISIEIYSALRECDVQIHFKFGEEKGREEAKRFIGMVESSCDVRLDEDQMRQIERAKTGIRLAEVEEELKRLRIQRDLLLDSSRPIPVSGEPAPVEPPGRGNEENMPF